MFRVEYALEQAGGREFGSVFVNEKENAALALVGAGLAKVRWVHGGKVGPGVASRCSAAGGWSAIMSEAGQGGLPGV